MVEEFCDSRKRKVVGKAVDASVEGSWDEKNTHKKKKSPEEGNTTLSSNSQVRMSGFYSHIKVHK